MSQQEKWVKGLFQLAEDHGLSPMSSRSPFDYLDDKIKVLQFENNALRTQLAGHGIEPVIVKR